MKPNKIIFGDEVLIDLTEDTVSHHKLLEGEIAHDSSGETIVGTIPVIEGEDFYEFTSKSDIHEIEEGYHKGNETVKIAQSEQQKILPENIKTGIPILGVEGTFTADGTAISDDILEGEIAYVRGERVVGVCRFDADTRDATATPNDLLDGKIAYARGEQITGAIPIYPGDGEIVEHYISEKEQTHEIEQGYHDGTESVSIEPSEQQKILPENIKTGIPILGVEGTFTADGTAISDDILEGEIAYVNGQLVEGTIPIQIEKDGAVQNHLIETKNQVVTIPYGYYGNSVVVRLGDEAVSDLTPEHILYGITILGVTGLVEPQMDTSDATATADDIAFGKTAYVNNVKITGTKKELTIRDEENFTGTTLVITSGEEGTGDELLDSGDNDQSDEG